MADRSEKKDEGQADLIVSLVKAGVSALDMFGGPIGSLIGDRLQDHTNKSVDLSLRCLKRRLVRLEGRVTREAIHKEEFSELFKAAFRVVLQTHREEKIRAAANVVANSLLVESDPEKLSFDELDLFVRLVDRLPSGALLILSHLQAAQGEPRTVLVEALKASLPEAPEGLPEAMLAELNAVGLVELRRLSVGAPDGSNFSVKVTPLGLRFMRSLVDWGTDVE